MRVGLRGRVVIACWLGLAVAASADQARSAPAPTIETLLQRAGVYVANFEREFTEVVAEERYVQNAPSRRRQLVSEFLVVRLPGTSASRPFRDVFQVDGRPVHDREDRLQKLFMQPTETSMQQAARIDDESSRLNIGLARTINVPTIGLAVLAPGRQGRFRFSQLKQDRIQGADVWSLDYEERARPTMIRGHANSDLAARGRVWIEAGTGTVWRTTLETADTSARSAIAVDFKADPRLGMHVPVTMSEEYVLFPLTRRDRGITRVSGTATYSRFRRFNVSTTEHAGAEVVVQVETAAGNISIAVDVAHAPITSANFLKYVDGGFYTSGRFHRATRDGNYTINLPNRPLLECIQAGINPERRSEGFAPIPLERTTVTGLRHVVGTVSMARGGPDSATSDFFILLNDQPSLDFGGKRFDDAQGAAAFGRVVAGMDVVRKIQQQPTEGQSLTPPVQIISVKRVQQ